MGVKRVELREGERWMPLDRCEGCRYYSCYMVVGEGRECFCSKNGKTYKWEEIRRKRFPDICPLKEKIED